MRHLFQMLLVGLALVVIALLSALATMRLAIHGAEVRIPNMSGMTIVQALNRLTIWACSWILQTIFTASLRPPDIF